MTLHLGVIMDPIDTIHPEKDSTLCMLLEAQRRAWVIHYMEQRDCFLLDGRAYARTRLLQVKDDLQKWYSFGAESIQPLDSLNFILMRKDPPVDKEFIHTTYLLELAEALGTLIVNKPQSLRDANEKLFTAWFPQYCPHTLVTHNAQQIRDFLKEHRDIILKPLDSMGGQSVFRLRLDDPNINATIEVLTDFEKRYTIAQRYIPEITKGDKRILLINGEPIPYALARIPAPGETRANLAAGGKGVGVPLTERERWICEQLAPTLKAKGLLFVGLDVIGDYLTEINVTSPTCIRQLDDLYGLNISGQLMDIIAELCAYKAKL